MIDAPPLSPEPSWRRTAAVGGLVFVLLTIWLLIVPPYQVGDEPQHAMRATSVLIQPWIAGGDHFVVDQRRTNPIARDPGPYLGKLFFRGDHFLTKDDVARIKTRRWGEQPIVDAPVREYWAGASYPTLYHLAVFAIAEPTTAVLHLTPYQSTYAYRLPSVILASLLWALVLRRLSTVLGLSEAQRVLVLLLSIPMLVFPSAGTNPDALVFPLATLSIVECWRVLQTGAGSGLAIGLLLLTALTKPSGLALALAVSAAGIGTWLVGGAQSARARAVVMASIVTLAGSYLCFYAWSPPRFLGAGPVSYSFTEWLKVVFIRLPTLWKMFWGWLGWLDYTLPPLWYKVLAALVLVNAVIAAQTMWRRRAQVFLLLVLASFAIIAMAGEFVYLSQAGLNLQGRHFLPAAVGLAPLVLHPVRPARWALMAFLVVMHLAFVGETVVRYYAGDLGTLVAALPFW